MKQLLFLFLCLLVRHFGVEGNFEDLVDVRIEVLLAELGRYLGVREEREARPGHSSCLGGRERSHQINGSCSTHFRVPSHCLR